LRKLAALIKKIIDLAKECGGSAVLKYASEGDKLVISKVDRKEMLPNDLYLRWENEYKIIKETESQNDGIREPELAETVQKDSFTVRRILNYNYIANVEALQTKTMGNSPKTRIKIGEVDYSVDVINGQAKTETRAAGKGKNV
jgi:hypothetical protein